MRIWDISPKKLCRKHLLGEHAELHALWVILTQEKKGFSKHPETFRWEGKLKALYFRHESLVGELTARGYRHESLLDKRLAVGEGVQSQFVDSPEEQVEILRDKACDCEV